MSCLSISYTGQCHYYGFIPRQELPGFTLAMPHAAADVVEEADEYQELRKQHDIFLLEKPGLYEIGNLPKIPGTLRIVIISDTHELHRQIELPPGDILIHCGDIQDGNAIFHRPKKQVQDFFEWFNDNPHPIKVFIAGNHDSIIANMPDDELRAMAAPAKYLNDSSVVIDPLGLRIYGSPRSTSNSVFSRNTSYQGKKAWRSFHGSHFNPLQPGDDEYLSMELPRPRSAQLHNNIVAREEEHPQGPIDILVTHQSPDYYETIASQPIMPYVQEVAPRRLHCCGHLHGSRGLHRLEVPEQVKKTFGVGLVVDGVYKVVAIPCLPCINASMLMSSGCGSYLAPCTVVDMEM